MPARVMTSSANDDVDGFSAILEEEEDDITVREDDIVTAAENPSKSSREDDISSPPPLFTELVGGGPGTGHAGERHDGAGDGDLAVIPWRGLLRKANSKVNVNE